MTKTTITFFFLSLLFTPLFATYTLGLFPGSKECFFTTLPPRATIVSGNFDILDDEAPSENLSVFLQNTKNPAEGKLWESEPSAREAIFSLTVDASLRLSLCFQLDEVDDGETEIDVLLVGWNIRVHAIPRELPEDESGPDTERAMNLVSKAVDIETDWSNLMDHFAFLRSREAVHMKLTSDILNRIMGWTLIEAFVVVLMAFAQVMYWKKFFEQRRYL